MKVGHYMLASWIGMMPGTIMYFYIGSLAKAVSGERVRTTGEWVLYGVGLLATVVVTIFVTRLAKRAMAKCHGSLQNQPLGVDSKPATVRGR